MSIIFLYNVQPFQRIATTIGLYFDGVAGTLTYYKDGMCLGVAFTNLQDVTEPLYPIVCSTAYRTGGVNITNGSHNYNMNLNCCNFVFTFLLSLSIFCN